LEPLADFRDRLQELSQPNSPYRMNQRRNGQDGNGPFTIEARRMILQELLAIQTGMTFQLISDAEVTRIKELWGTDQTLFAVNKANRLLSILGDA
jgi:DNA sulfur modification protein DndC